MARVCPQCGQRNSEAKARCGRCGSSFTLLPPEVLRAPEPPAPTVWPWVLLGLVLLGGLLAMAFWLGQSLVTAGARRVAVPAPPVVLPAPPAPEAADDAGALPGAGQESDDLLANLGPAARALLDRLDAGARQRGLAPTAPTAGAEATAEKRRPPPRVIRVPYQATEGAADRIIVEVTFNGSTSAPMAIDTGAPGTVISPRLAERVGALRAERGKLLTLARGIGGSALATFVFLDSIAVDEARSDFVPATVTEVASDAFEGLVGMDFLGRYKVEIDTQQHELVLTEGEARAEAPGGHDERWWRRWYAYLGQERGRWSAVLAHFSTQERQELATQARELAESQLRELDTLTRRLDGLASEHAVPTEWRDGSGR